MKKGISPLIAAVILIAFVIAVAAVASGFFSGFIKKRQSEISGKGETVVECGVANLDIQEDFLECSAPNWDSMVARWHLDEGSGLTVYDSSQNSNSGTLLDDNTTNDDGDDPPHWVKGKFGKALKFDGVDDYVEIPDDSSLDLSTAFTVEAWIKTTTVHSGWASIAEKKVAYMLQLYNNAPEGNLGINNGTDYFDLRGETSLTDGDWYHLVGTFDQGEAKLYVGDQLDDSDTTEMRPQVTSNYLIMGHGNVYFNGTIDEVRIYDRALSKSQIEYLYSHGTQLKFPILNKGQTSLGKKFGVTAIINKTTRSGSVSLDTNLDKAQIRTITALENISVGGKLEKVRIASKACGNVYDVVEPSGIWC